VLYNLHAPIWWGALMGIAGLAYTIKSGHELESKKFLNL